MKENKENIIVPNKTDVIHPEPLVIQPSIGICAAASTICIKAPVVAMCEPSTQNDSILPLLDIPNPNVTVIEKNLQQMNAIVDVSVEVSKNEDISLATTTPSPKIDEQTVAKQCNLSSKQFVHLEVMDEIDSGVNSIEEISVGHSEEQSMIDSAMIGLMEKRTTSDTSPEDTIENVETFDVSVQLNENTDNAAFVSPLVFRKVSGKLRVLKKKSKCTTADN